MKRLKKILNTSFALFAICAIVVVLILFVFPIYLISLPFSQYRNRKFDDEYREFLVTQNDSLFFVYTNKRKTMKFVEELILPNINKEIKIIFLEGKTPRTDLDGQYISRLLNGPKVVGGFPWLIKISNCEPQIHSLNNSLYNAIKGQNPQTVLSLINSLQ